MPVCQWFLCVFFSLLSFSVQFVFVYRSLTLRLKTPVFFQRFDRSDQPINAIHSNPSPHLNVFKLSSVSAPSLIRNLQNSKLILMANNRMTSKEQCIAMNKEPHESRPIAQDSGNSDKNNRMPAYGAIEDLECDVLEERARNELEHTHKPLQLSALVNNREAKRSMHLTALATIGNNISSSSITSRAIVPARIFIPGSFTFTPESVRATIRREFIPGRGPFSVIHHRDPARTKVAYLKAPESSKFGIPKLGGTVVERLDEEQDDEEEE